MKIGTKIRGGFVIMIAIGLIVGIVGILSIFDLTRMSNELHDLEVEAAGIATVLQAHYTWRHGLIMSSVSGEDFTGSVDPDTCALGKWLSSEEGQITDSEVLMLIDSIHQPHHFIHNEAKAINVYLQNDDREMALAHAMNTILPETEKVISILVQMDDRYAVLIDAKTSEIVADGASVTIVIIAFVVVALIVGIFFSWFIPAGIIKPLTLVSTFMKKAGTTGDINIGAEESAFIQRLSGIKNEIGDLVGGASAFIRHVARIAGELESIAEGDLTTDVELLSDADAMGKSLNNMTDSFNNMFRDINASSNHVSTGAKQIADGSQALARGSTEQTASVEKLSLSISEIAQKTKENAEKADKAALLANTIKGNAEKGSRQMGEMTAAVKDINTASQNIKKVIKVIDDIAFQTNILALNAAVEAARAGQHGKGFAVVAEEVRNLASKSADAARETGEMIENSMEKAELGSRIADETAASLAEIVSGINESSQIVSEIAQSSEEQSAGISQINQGIDQVANVVQQNSATAEESAAASKEMSGQSSILEELIAQFKLKGATGSGLGAGHKKQFTMPENTLYNEGGGEYGKY
ncbi:MAG: methyl-accepting chemotaxis protein [Oscillospiraceae bacterium]|nr:methyl-accepting chemotaxis protein [Oscillospiraceae bacterium]